MASAKTYNIQVTSPKLANRRVSGWLRAEQMGQHVAFIKGENLTTGDLVTLDQENALDSFLGGVLEVPQPARAQISAKCKTLQVQHEMERLEELIARTKDQLAKLNLGKINLANDTKTIEREIDEHFDDLNGQLMNRVIERLLAESTRVKSELKTMARAKRARIDRHEKALSEQLKTAEALSQSAGGKMGKIEVLTAIGKVLDNEVEIDRLDPGAIIFEANKDAVDQIAFDVKFADIRCALSVDETFEEIKSQDAKPQIETDRVHRQRVKELQAIIDSVHADESAQIRQVMKRVANARYLAEYDNNLPVRILYGHCAKKNPSPYKQMQDTMQIAPKLHIATSKCTSSSISVFAVFDGHGGTQCSAFCAKHIVDIVTKALGEHENGFNALHAAMAELNQRASKATTDSSGSTACVVMIDRATRDLWCCNVGDSRCILIDNECSRVEQLSVDHTPRLSSEKKRILENGGFLKFNPPKVCGLLSVSRRIGDNTVFDKHCTSGDGDALVLATPAITHHKLLAGQNKYLVVASDGLFSDSILGYSNEQCMQAIRPYRISSLGDVQKMTNNLVKNLKMAQDDVSAIVLKICVRM